MKMKILLLLVVFTIKSFGQDTLAYQPTHKQIFSLSPISKKVDTVNGLVLGVGHYENININLQTINGFNVEASPMVLAILFFTFEKNSVFYEYNTKIRTVVNGINISSGGFMSGAKVSGINVSTLSAMNNMNGISISGLFFVSRQINGISISGVENYSEKLNGISISIINQSKILNGCQIGLYNSVENNMNGLQIGLINISSKTKGLQIGLLNINKKRTLPFINF